MASARAIGFKVAGESNLDRAAHHFKANGCTATFVERPYQGRTLSIVDPFGMPVEFHAKMEQRERLLQQYAHHKGVQPQRLDHFNMFASNVQRQIDFYAGLGFQLTEYAEEDGPGGRIAAASMHRKANVLDLAFTNDDGPRLHHLA